MIVTNVVKRKYIIRVFEMNRRGKRGKQIEQFVLEAESSECAKLQADSIIKERLERCELHDYNVMIDVMPMAG